MGATDFFQACSIRFFGTENPCGLAFIVVVVVFFYFPSEASTVMNTTLKRADNRVEGCGVRKKIIIIIRDI